MAEDTPTEDDLVRIMDEWVDDLAPLNRGAFKFAARAIVERYPLGLTVQPTVQPSEREARLALHRMDCGCPEPDAKDHVIDYGEFAATVLALLPGRTEREALAQGWDEGAEAMNENFYWHDGGRELNPYRKEANRD